MPRETRRELTRYSDPATAILASGKNPDGTDFAMPVESFDEWAERNGYLQSVFSGEVVVPGSAGSETTLINVTVPAGQTWYQRYADYTASGSKPGQFKFYRTLPPAAEAYANLEVVPANSSHELVAHGKFPAGSGFRVTVKPSGTQNSSDIVTVRMVYVALPWAE